jgi:4-amino-4-deoxy-L-arabinose transferase-like glycosyltransferase
MEFLKNISTNIFGKIFIALLTTFVLAFPIFTHLADHSIRLWDESINVLHAINMSLNHNFLMRMRDGVPDMWETKPPFLIWCMVLSIKLFGYNELAYRLPTAFAGIGIMAVLFYFFKKLKVNAAFLTAFFVSLILVSSVGFYKLHVVRTADNEAIYMLLALLGLFHIFCGVEKNEVISKSIYLAAIFFCLSVLTKSVAPLMFLPGVFIFLLVEKKMLRLLRNKHFYFAVILFLIPILSYYLLRERYNHGYIRQVLYMEGLPRYFNSEGHYNNENFGYYFILMKNEQFAYFFPFVFISIIWCCFFAKEKSLGRFFSIQTLSFFFIVSKGANNGWYDFPLIIFSAIIVGLALRDFIFMTVDFIKAKQKNVAIGIIAVLIFATPYCTTIYQNTNIKTLDDSPEICYGYAFRAFQQQNISTTKFFVLEKYNLQMAWHLKDYVEVFNKIKHYQITRIDDWKKLKVGDVVMTPFWEQKDSLRQQFVCKTLLNEYDCELIKLTALKQ